MFDAFDMGRILIYYMTGSLRSKMTQILRYDWLPVQARWCYLAYSGLPAVFYKKIVFFLHIINPLLTTIVRSRSLNTNLVFLCVFMDFNYVSVHENTEKNSANIQPS